MTDQVCALLIITGTIIAIEYLFNNIKYFVHKLADVEYYLRSDACIHGIGIPWLRRS